jgi:hypothetical protein
VAAFSRGDVSSATTAASLEIRTAVRDGGGRDAGRARGSPRGAGDALLLHPVPLLAIALTAANDHLLKTTGVLPGWLTGKLSDVSGLFFFPLALVAAVRAVGAWRGRCWAGAGSPIPALAAVATAALFACFKLSPGACAWLAPVAAVVPDPTDLVALPMAAVSWWWMARRRAGRAFRSPAWARLVVLGAAALTSAATSPSRAPRFYRPLPMWTVTGPGVQALGCADVELWVSKSGREGVGLTVAVRSRDAACELRLERLALAVPGVGEVAAAGLPVSLARAAREPAFRYFAVAFDNDAAWRRKEARRGVATLQVTDGGGARALRFDLVHRRADDPILGTSFDRGLLNVDTGCARPVALLITETDAAGIHAVLRVHAPPPPPCTLHVGRVELLADKAVIASASPGITALLESDTDAGSEVPLYLPAAHDLRRRISGAAALTFRVELGGNGGQAAWVEWPVGKRPSAGADAP